MLPGLKVKIGADTSELDRKLGDTRARLRRFAAVAGAAVAAASTAMVALTSRTARAANEIAILAQVANTTPEIMQRWAAGSATVGIEQEKLADILKDVNDRIGDFVSTGGGPMADFFENIAPLVGVTADQFARLSGPEALQLYVDSLEKAGLNQQQMTFYLEAMASDATRLIPLLRNSGEEMNRFGDRAEGLGFVLDRNATQALQRAQIALIGAQQAITGVANQLAAALAPAVELMANAFTNLMMAGNPFRDLLNAIFARIPAYLASVTAFAGFMAGRYVAALVAARVATMTFAGSLVAVRAALIRTGIGAVVVLLGELVFRAASAAEKFGGLGKVIGALWSIFKDRFERMKAMATVFGTNFQLMVNDIKFKFQLALIDMATKFFEFANSTAKTMNDIFKTNFATDMGSEVIGSLTDKLATTNDEMVSILGKQAEAITRLDQPVLTLEELLNQVKETTDDLGTSTDDVTTDMAAGFNLAANAANDLQNVLTAAQSRAKSAAEMIGQKMEDAFMGMIDGTKSAGDAFRSMAKSIIAELFRIFVVKRITGFITNAIGSALGVPAAAMAPAVESYEGGGYTGMGPRSGGVDGRGGFPAIVHPNETIIDHNKIGNTMAGGGVTVVQHNTFGNGVNRAEINAMLPKIVEASKAAVLDAKRRGGSYGGAF